MCFEKIKFILWRIKTAPFLKDPLFMYLSVSFITVSPQAFPFYATICFFTKNRTHTHPSSLALSLSLSLSVIRKHASIKLHIKWEEREREREIEHAYTAWPTDRKNWRYQYIVLISSGWSIRLVSFHDPVGPNSIPIYVQQWQLPVPPYSRVVLSILCQRASST